ncbi:MAG: hypothetical protein J6X18_00470 [Bacteroidales bacterium]|nr:hypothetical protein [Bacteroidales bacterium]
MKKINLNDVVLVELNERGWKQIENYYRVLYGVFGTDYQNIVESGINLWKRHTKPMVIDGEVRMMTQFQMYDFMNIFGDSAYCGAENFIVGNNVCSKFY